MRAILSTMTADSTAPTMASTILISPTTTAVSLTATTRAQKTIRNSSGIGTTSAIKQTASPIVSTKF